MARANGATLVLLAHHRRDQAETLLLQALRGGGVAGLACMPKRAVRNGITYARPWLDRPPEAIAAYVRARRIRHVEDESNHDVRHDRNRLRQVWPAFEAAFPHSETALAASAQRMQEAHDALEELASLDLQSLAPDGPLRVQRWLQLSPARASHALRAWIRRALGTAPSAALLARLQAELPRCQQGRWLLPEGTLQLHRGALHALPRSARGDSTPREHEMTVDAPGVYPLPGWQGVLQVEPTSADGVALAMLRRVQLVARRGGERWQAGHNRPARSLKKQYQAAGVPAWERDAPLLYGDGRLLYVPGLGIDARVRAAAGEPQVALRWLARGAEHRDA